MLRIVDELFRDEEEEAHTDQLQAELVDESDPDPLDEDDSIVRGDVVAPSAENDNENKTGSGEIAAVEDISVVDAEDDVASDSSGRLRGHAVGVGSSSAHNDEDHGGDDEDEFDDDDSNDVTNAMNEEIGIAKFNAAVRKHVPEQLPVAGIRSWKLLGYVATVIIFSYSEIILFYDAFDIQIEKRQFSVGKTKL